MALTVSYIPRTTVVFPRKLRCVVKALDSEQRVLAYSGELLRKKGFQHIPFQKIGSKTDTIKIFLFLSKNPKFQGTHGGRLCVRETGSMSRQKPRCPSRAPLSGYGSPSVGDTQLRVHGSSVSALQVEAVISHF